MADTGYKTKQRQLILDYMMAHASEHVTVEEVFDALKSQGESVGKTTVYRHMEKLVAAGSVRKYHIEGGTSACYQYQSGNACHEHFHLKCVSCGKLIHLDCDFMHGIDSHIFEHHGFRIDNTQTVFYGVCSGCEKGVQTIES